jgi:Zn-finger nucleic acid-binding protein
MPNREDEFWINQKDNNFLRCPVHNKLYKINFGCEVCQLENVSLLTNNKIFIKLEECPRCKELSLNWNEKTQCYECLNLRCEFSFNKNEFEEYASSLQFNQTNNTNIKKGNNESDLCPSCRNGVLIWSDTIRLYECSECKRRLSRFMKKGLDKLLKG